MTTSVENVYTVYKNELVDLKTQIKELDKSWKNLTGSVNRDDSRLGFKDTNTSDPALSRSDHLPRKRAMKGSITRNTRRRYDDPTSRPSLASSVVASSIVSGGHGHKDDPDKDRETFVEEQKKMEQDLMKRHKRMFGLIVGTLARFQNEETQRRGTVEKREEINRKLERAEKEEQDKISTDKERIMTEKRAKEVEIRRVQLKLDRVASHQQWEEAHQKLSDYIQTRTKPSLCWIPKMMCPMTEKKLKETRDKNRLISAEKRAKLHKELSDIDGLYEKDINGAKTNLDVKPQLRSTVVSTILPECGDSLDNNATP